MINYENAIKKSAYSELLILCQTEGCNCVFQPTLDDPATDPVEDWSEKMAKLAVKQGWSANEDGQVMCPTHGSSKQR